MSPITNKIVSKTVATNLEQGQGEIQKTEPSKFDQVRAAKLDQAATPVNLPPPVTEVSAQQKQTLQTQLNQRAQRTSSTPQDVLKVDLGNTKVSLNKLGKKVSALPKTQAFDSIRNRMTGIEQQFNNAGAMLNNAGTSKSPQDLLNVQMQMYMLGENIQLVSKVVDQVTSGVKTILQTQI